MDRLKNKNYRQYDYASRYSNFPYYYNTLDNKYVYGITGHVDKSISFVVHKIRESDTLDSLSLIYYGRPDYYWIIADYNDIVDPFVELWGKYEALKIPSFSSIRFKQ